MMNTVHSWGMPGFIELAVIGVIMLFAVVLTVLPFWFIFKRAGFPGVLSLLMLVPVVSVVMLFFLAFAEWPALTSRSQDDFQNGP